MYHSLKLVATPRSKTEIEMRAEESWLLMRFERGGRLLRGLPKPFYRSHPFAALAYGLPEKSSNSYLKVETNVVE